MRILCLWVLGAAALSFSASAEIIYDNSTNYEEKFNDSLLETGDEINLAGTARLATAFAFEYFGEFALTGDETARVRFYQMNGVPGENEFPTPGTLLYDSGAFNITSGYHSVSITELSVLLPEDKITWSVEFGGINPTESVGLLYYNPPTVGSSDAYFWEKENGSWLAVATDGTGNNFAAQLTAVQATPPPGFRIANARNQGGAAALTLSGAIPGKAYTLEYKSSVTEACWSKAPVQVRATGSEVTLLDASAQGARFRIYRVLEQNTTIARAAGQANVISFAVPGRRYALQRSSSLTAWTDVMVQIAAGNTVSFAQPISTTADEFFRVIELL
jgi:hypothetical protein